MICTIDGCAGAARGHGYCSRHYTQWRRHGDPLLMKRRYHKGILRGRAVQSVCGEGGWTEGVLGMDGRKDQYGLRDVSPFA